MGVAKYQSEALDTNVGRYWIYTYIYIICFTPLQFIWLSLGPLFFQPTVKCYLHDMTWQGSITPNVGKVMETLFLHLHVDTQVL